MVDFAKRNRRAAIRKQKVAAINKAAGLPVAAKRVAKTVVNIPTLPTQPARRVSDLAPSPPVQRRQSAPLKSLSAQAVSPSAPRREKVVTGDKRKDQMQVPAPSDKRITDPVAPTCKPRPTSTKGSGGSRSFVPWCK